MFKVLIEFDLLKWIDINPAHIVIQKNTLIFQEFKLLLKNCVKNPAIILPIVMNSTLKLGEELYNIT